MEELLIVLPQELTIYNVAAFKEEILEKLDSSSVLFDCVNLEYIDAAGIQLLLSLEKTLLNQGMTLKLINLSNQIEESLDLFGIDSILNLKGDVNNGEENFSS